MRHALFSLAAAAILGLAVSGSAQALTYDSHVYRDANGAPAFQDPDNAFSAHFSGGESSGDNGGNNSPFLNSSDRNFSAPIAGAPFGGMLPDQNR